MPKTRGGWKTYERVVAALAGWDREPVTGRRGPGGDPGDARSGPFYTEIRDRAEARPLRWFRETAEAARRAGKIPLLLFKGPARHLSPLAIMRWTDLAEVIILARRGADLRSVTERAVDHHPGAPGPGGGGGNSLPGRAAPPAPGAEGAGQG